MNTTPVGSKSLIYNTPVIGSATISGSAYEVVGSESNKSLRLKYRDTFDVSPSRAIALADSEYGWNWFQRGKVVSATENVGASGAMSIIHDMSLSQWNTGGQNAIVRYKQYASLFYTYRQEWIARIASNSNEDFEAGGLIAYASDNTANFIRVGLHYGTALGGIVVQARVAGNTAQAVITSTQRDNGIWIRLVRYGRAFRAYYNLANQDTPPTTWTLLSVTGQDTVVAAVDTMVNVGVLVSTGAVPSSALTVTCKKFIDKYAMLPITEDDNPTWGATLYDASSPAVSLITDFNLKTTYAQISTTLLRQALRDAENLMPRDAATWTYSAVRSSSPGAPAGSYQSAAELTVSGTGKYFNLYAKCTSNGTQPGSLHLPLTIPVNV